MKAEVHAKDLRVAWIAPTLARSWRWQPVMREFHKVFPGTTVFTGEWPGYLPGFEEEFKIRLLRGIRFIDLGYHASGSPKGFSWASPGVFRELWKYRPHAILTNGFHMCSVYAVLLKLLVGSRVILLWQGISPETGGTRGIRLRLRRLLARFFDTAICNTREGVEYLQRLVKMPSGKVLRRTFEVADRDSLSLRKSAHASIKQLPSPVFLYVGRMIRGKGVPQLLEAFRLLRQQERGRFTALMVGDGVHAAELKATASQYGLDDCVRWVGPVPYEGLGAVYEMADALILPSLEDTWGVVVMEAMAFGKPVICSRYAGCNEVVQHGVNGFVFDPHHPQELADYLARLIREPDLPARCGAASTHITTQYTPAAAAAAIASAVVNGSSGSLDSGDTSRFPPSKEPDVPEDAWRQAAIPRAAVQSQAPLHSTGRFSRWFTKAVRPLQVSSSWISRGALALLDQGLSSVSNFILAIVLARALAPASYGAYALAFEVFLLLQVIQVALILEPMSVFGPSQFENRFGGYWRALVRLQILMGLVAALLLASVAWLMGRLTAASDLTTAMFGVAVAWPSVSFFWLVRRRSYVNLNPGGAALGGFVYLVALLSGLFALNHWGHLTAFSAFVLMSAAGLVTGLAMLAYRPSPREGIESVGTLDVARRHWEYGRWALASSAAIWLSAAIYYPLLFYFHGAETTGFLKVLLNLNSPVGQAFVAISLLALPHASRVRDRESTAGVTRVAYKLVLIYAVGTLAYWAILVPFGKPVVNLLYAGQYSEVVPFIPLVALWSTLRIGATAQAITLRAMHSPMSVFLAYASACAVAVVAGIPATLRFGMIGALWTLALSGAVALFVSLWLSRRKVHHEMTFRDKNQGAIAVSRGLSWPSGTPEPAKGRPTHLQ